MPGGGQVPNATVGHLYIRRVDFSALLSCRFARGRLHNNKMALESRDSKNTSTPKSPHLSKALRWWADRRRGC